MMKRDASRRPWRPRTRRPSRSRSETRATRIGAPSIRAIATVRLCLRPAADSLRSFAARTLRFVSATWHALDNRARSNRRQKWRSSGPETLYRLFGEDSLVPRNRLCSVSRSGRFPAATRVRHPFLSASPSPYGYWLRPKRTGFSAWGRSSSARHRVTIDERCWLMLRAMARPRLTGTALPMSRPRTVKLTSPSCGTKA